MQRRLEQIRDRLIAFHEGRATAPLPPCDCVYLLRIAEASENLLKHTISNRVSKTIDLSELKKALEGD